MEDWKYINELKWYINYRKSPYEEEKKPDKPINYFQDKVENIVNPFPHTTNLRQTTLKLSTQKYGKSLLL